MSERFNSDWEYKRYLESRPALEVISAGHGICKIWIPEMGRRVECYKNNFGVEIEHLSDMREYYSPVGAQEIDSFFRVHCRTGSHLRRRISQAAEAAMANAHAELQKLAKKRSS